VRVLLYENIIMYYSIIMQFYACKFEFPKIAEGQGRPGPARGQGQGQLRVVIESPVRSG
jgi:hypothetical protein